MELFTFLFASCTTQALDFSRNFLDNNEDKVKLSFARVPQGRLQTEEDRIHLGNSKFVKQLPFSLRSPCSTPRHIALCIRAGFALYMNADLSSDNLLRRRTFENL